MLVLYVIVSGVHGSAWTAVVKDVMILAVVVTLGIYLPMHYYGGYGAMFATIERNQPAFLVLPPSGMSPTWLISTVLLSAFGFFMWPHSFASIYTARSEQVFRRNAVIMPFYQLMLISVLFVGFVALLQMPGLKGPDGDLALLRISKATFSPAAVGVIGAAGLLTALVPGSMLLIAISTILVQNVLRPAFPSLDSRMAAGVAKALVPVVAIVGVWLTLRPGNAVVPLLLMGYNLVTQLFPLVVLALPQVPLASRTGALMGIIAGEATVAFFSLSGGTLVTWFPSWPKAITDINVGMIALLVNVMVVTVVSLGTRKTFVAHEYATARARRAVASGS